jgi:hypothetical protein
VQRWRGRPGARSGEFPQFPQAVLSVEVVQRRKIIGISGISAGRFVELPTV